MAKRGNGEGSIDIRSDGMARGRITVNGKTQYVYAKTKTEVRRKLKELQDQIEKGTFVFDKKVTVEQWANVWLSNLRGNQETYSSYETKIRLHVIPAIGNKRLTELKPVMINQFYNRMMEKGYKTKETGLSDKTIACIHGVLHKMLQDAVVNDLIKENVCDKVKPPKSDAVKEEMHPLRDHQIPTFIDMIRGNRLEWLFYFAMFTGARESEIIGVSWDCIDFERGTIHLYRQLKRDRKLKEYIFTNLKNKESRTFAPPAKVMAVLKTVKKQQAEWRLKAGKSWSNPNNLVFTNELGEHLSARTVYREFKKVVVKMGIPEVVFHDLRHTYATIALQNGVDYKTLSNNLGHATVAFTMDVYGHISETMMRESAARIDNFIEQIK